MKTYREARPAYVLANKKTIAALRRQYYLAHSDELATLRASHRSERRSKWLKHYGITEEQYNEVLVKQGGKCAVCGEDNLDIRGNPSHLCVDHDHATGKIRGLLCKHCNIAAGNLRDSPERALRLAKYLLPASQNTNNVMAQVPAHRARGSYAIVNSGNTI